jgi:phosphonate transport system substrate-binding protein
MSISDARTGRRKARCTEVVAIAIVIAALLLTGGCIRSDPEDTSSPGVLRVALIPDRPQGDIERDFKPLLDYVAAQTGLSIELLFAENYEQALDMFANRQVHLMRFGGLTYALAHHRHGARALVTRDVDLRFRSVIVAHADLAAEGLESLRGRSMGFGSRYSTSGHVMPRVFLQAQGIVPEDYFSEIRYAGDHFENIQAIVEGEIDAAAVNALIFERTIRHHEDYQKSIQIIWASPLYANYLWATQPDMDLATSHSIREAFLGLTTLDKNHQQILYRVGAGGFLPAQHKNYDSLISYIRNQELSR